MTDKNIHESEKLNGLIGKKVKIIMWDGRVEIGILGRSEYSKRYKLDRPYKGSLHFYKTHIKKIEVAENDTERTKK